MLVVDADILRVLNHFADKHNVNKETILAIAIQESGLNPWQIGDAGKSFGMMQIHLEGAGSGQEDWMLLDLAFNLELACSYYAECVAATRTREDAISSYNQGIAGYQASGRSVNVGYWTNVIAIRERLIAEGVRGEQFRPYFTWE